MVRKYLAAVAVAAVAVTALAACNPPAKGSRILVFGDSITAEMKGSPEAEAVLSSDYLMDWAGVKFMASPCNGLKVNLNKVARPAVVVLNYSGNSGSLAENCMNPGDNVAVRYRKDMNSLVSKVKAKWPGVRVVLMSGPTREPSITNSIRSRNAASMSAKDMNVAYFDGRRDISPDDRLLNYGYCLKEERDGKGYRNRAGQVKKLKCLTGANGDKNRLRDNVREHLCPAPGRAGLSGRCTTTSGSDVYSSGAVRLAFNLKAALAVSK